MSDQTVQIKYIGTAQRWPELSITGRQSVWMPGQIESRSPSEASALLATGLFSSPPVPVTAVTSPGGGIEFPADVQEAIIAIAGDAGSGTAQIVDGYPVEVAGTSEVVVSAVPCDVVWIAHNGVAGTITLRDAATTGSGLAAAKTVDMAATPTMQAGGLRTQYGLSAVLTAGKATFWVRPL